MVKREQGWGHEHLVHSECDMGRSGLIREVSRDLTELRCCCPQRGSGGTESKVLTQVLGSGGGSHSRPCTGWCTRAGLR